MNEVIVELDQRRAQEFFTRHDAAKLVDLFRHECDAELLSDMTKLACYIWCREQGVDQTFAHMRACRRTPGTKNMDRTFGISSLRHMNGMGRNLEKIVAIAKKAGISTQGKFYVGGLGRYDDPHAWCASAEDVFTAAKLKHLTLSGPLNYQGASESPEPPPKVKLAPDVMRRLERQRLKSEPGLAERVKRSPRARKAVREEIVAAHTRKPKV